jgi:hypothetical protein
MITSPNKIAALLYTEEVHCGYNSDERSQIISSSLDSDLNKLMYEMNNDPSFHKHENEKNDNHSLGENGVEIARLFSPPYNHPFDEEIYSVTHNQVQTEMTSSDFSFKSLKKITRKKRKRENKISSVSIVKSFHKMQERPKILKTFDCNVNGSGYFGNNNRYSKRKRFPKLNHICGDRISYEYKRGELVDSYVLVSKQMDPDDEEATSESVLSNKRERFKFQPRRILIPPQEHKTIKQMCFPTVLNIVKPSSDFSVSFEKTILQNLMENEDVQIAANFPISVKNFSKTNDIIIKITRNFNIN